MKKYIIPTSRIVDLGTESPLLDNSMQIGGGNGEITDENQVLTNRQNSLWDTWTE